MIRRRRQGRIIYLGYLVVVFQEPGYLFRVGYVTFYAQGQRFQALDEEPGVEGADAGTQVAQCFCPDARNEAGTRDIRSEIDTIVGFIGCCDFRETARTGPIEFSVFYDEAA